MSFYSKQKIFCNACGKEESRILPGMGKDYKVCSRVCLREMQWRAVLSMMNKEYYPHPDPNYYDETAIELRDGKYVKMEDYNK